MKDNLREIKTGSGLGNIKFGSYREDVKALLGAPSEKETDSDSVTDEEAIEMWHYDELGFSVSFSQEDDWRLTSIAVSDEFFTFNGEHLIGTERMELLQKLEKMQLGALDHEDWSDDDLPNQEVISALEHNINFWLEDGELSEIQWGPTFKDEDTFYWPS